MSTTADTTRTAPAYDLDRVRADFPILNQQVNGRPLAYLDNAATTQKPTAVLDAINHCYLTYYSNIHRGLHTLSEQATAKYEQARSTVRRFINAPADHEVIMVRGATEGINLVAQSYARSTLNPGDEILITHLEHHSNIVPWQVVAEQTGAKLRVAPIDDRGQVIVDEFETLLSDRTRIVALNHVSNALGTINPIARLTALAHDAGAIVLIDGAQAAPHMAVDVQAIGCDFYVFSGHKTYGPSGVGALWGREELLDAMPPYQSGGDMIKSVTFERTMYNDLPYKFEAGTPNIAGVIGLGAAIDYLNELGLDAIAAHEHALLDYATQQAHQIDGLRIIGTADSKAAVLSFVLDCAHPHDIGTIVDRHGVAVRTGHHCAQPVMDRFDVPATARASFGLYNRHDEIDALIAAIRKVRDIFA